MSKKYSIFRFIGKMYKLFGVFLVLMALIASIAIIVISLTSNQVLIDLSNTGFIPQLTQGENIARGGVLSLLIFVILSAVGLTQIAIGELFSLLLALEENTRFSAAYLRRQT
jgi:hypothetical protein